MDLAQQLEHVAQNITIARWAKGFTQQELANKGGFSYKHLQEIEGGRRTPTLPTLFRLAKALGTTVSELTAVPPYRDPGIPFLGELDVKPPKRGRKRKS